MRFVLGLPLLCLPLAAQERADTERLELRVVSGLPGRATLDRGRVDGLREGDRVVLRPRVGLPIEGRVVEVSERGATLEFDDATRSAPPGTRGEAWIPRERLGAAPVPAPAEPAEPQDGAPPAHPAWPAGDQDWRQGMPLLTEVPALHPAQREPRTDGRWYLIADHLYEFGEERQYGFDRVGVDTRWRNPFGNGADVHFAGEADSRFAIVPDPDDESEAYVRLDRLSYVLGGDRFERERVEIGRFLQEGLPELGLLDGLEWATRLIGGTSYGASLGYMPELDNEQESFRDLQLAAWYRWVADESERSSWQLGYQKTFHDYKADRDLVVARIDVVPENGWDLHGTAWVDFYSGHDDAKGSGVELTQAIVSLGRQFEGGSSLVLSATHMAFPEMDRFEPPPVSAAQLADDRVDRIAVRGRQGSGGPLWLREEFGVWSDQDDDGADAELGVEFDDVLFDEMTARMAGFGLRSSTSHVWGLRLGLEHQLDSGSWGVGYEFTQYDFIGFTEANDQLPQYRLRLVRDFHSQSGWDFSIHGEWLHFAEEDALSAGLYLQRSF